MKEPLGLGASGQLTEGSRDGILITKIWREKLSGDQEQGVKPDGYTVRIFWSDEDSGWIAVAEELEGCSAWGLTREEALREIETAILAWLESARKHGDPIPPPRSYKEAV